MRTDDSPPPFSSTDGARDESSVWAHGLAGALLHLPEPPALAPPVVALDPQRLSAEADARVQAILADEHAANTWRTYRHALKLWCAWYAARYGGTLPLPVPVPVVQQFMLDFVAHAGPDAASWGPALPLAIDELLVQLGLKAARGPWALNTVETRVAALAAAHRHAQHPSPTETTEILRLRRALRRHHALRGTPERHARALTRLEIRRMMAVCEDGLRGIRDRALIAVGFASGGRRRSEIAAMQLEALERNPDGSFTYTLGRSKTNQLAKPRPKDRKPIRGAAAKALALWLTVLEEAGIDRGPIWRRIEGDRPTTPLSASTVYDIVVKRARQAGISGAVMAHSLRVGFVTEALQQHLPLSKIMDKTGHETLQSLRHYDRPEYEAGDDPTAQLLK